MPTSMNPVPILRLPAPISKQHPVYLARKVGYSVITERSVDNPGLTFATLLLLSFKLLGVSQGVCFRSTIHPKSQRNKQTPTFKT
eukprot:3233337-Amphidinium_carterae.1